MQLNNMKNIREKSLEGKVTIMNKLMGFYELKTMNLPSIPWKEYTGTEELDSEKLWTIRSAVFKGDDLNLPRMVGEIGKKAKDFADSLLKRLKDRGMVIYYPYFVANKSGTLNIFWDGIIIEAVKDDLWNLVTYSDREVTIRIDGSIEQVDGNKEFLSDDEKNEILRHVPEIRKLFRDELIEGKSILLEWSFAQDSSANKEPVGDEYLVFYEARTI
ncbi:MAG: hypothetical protein MR278_06900 [Bacteroidales bacterium]|nr:hypothetical protein [Anaerotignum sp.]MCI5679685.1 hypothetical protein [Bacteroidales bacterium]MDY3925730.1 hypothetical protein [Anaerotignum sp.]